MTDNQITALAREYAEADGYGLQIIQDDTEMFLRWLSRRYCLVEKSKVEIKHNEALAALESNDNEDIKWGTYRISLLKSLFPEIAKEVEG